MALKIRLARGGSVHDAHYRIVVIESTKQRDGKAVDVIGHYHPNYHNENRVCFDFEKLNKWVGVGARPSEIVVKLCSKSGSSALERFAVKHAKGKNHGKSKKEVKAEAKA